MVVDFLGEETNDFGLSCLGSRALAGSLTVDELDRADHDGTRLGDRYSAFDLDPSKVLEAAAQLKKRPLHRYVELHVEQGPALQESGVSIGVVTAIAGIERLVANFIGQADHAGTTPMANRRDAMAAAAAAVLAIRHEGCGAPTHGCDDGLEAHRQARFAQRRVERGALVGRSPQRRCAMVCPRLEAGLPRKIRARAHDYGVEVDIDWWTDNDVVQVSEIVENTIATTVASLGISWQPIPSGAVHDAVHMARLCPMGMMFVPSRDGRSHCPEEWTDRADMVTGVHALAATILELDKS